MDDVISFASGLKNKNIVLHDQTIDCLIKEKDLPISRQAICNEIEKLGLEKHKRKVVVGYSSDEEMYPTRQQILNLTKNYHANCIFSFDEVGYQLYDESSLSCFGSLKEDCYLDRESKLSNCLFGGNTAGVLFKPLFIVDDCDSSNKDSGNGVNYIKIVSNAESIFERDVKYWLKQVVIPKIKLICDEYHQSKSLLIINEYFKNVVDSYINQEHIDFIDTFYIPNEQLDSSDPITSLFLLFGTTYNSLVPYCKNCIRRGKRDILSSIIIKMSQNNAFCSFFRIFFNYYVKEGVIPLTQTTKATSWFKNFITENYDNFIFLSTKKSKLSSVDSENFEIKIKLSGSPPLDQLDESCRVVAKSLRKEEKLVKKIETLINKNVVVSPMSLQVFCDEEKLSVICLNNIQEKLEMIRPSYFPLPNQNEIEEFREEWKEIEKYDKSMIVICDEFGYEFDNCTPICAHPQVGGVRVTRESRHSPIFCGMTMSGRMLEPLCCCPKEYSDQLRLLYPNTIYLEQNQFGITRNGINKWISESLIDYVVKQRDVLGVEGSSRHQAIAVMCESYREIIDNTALESNFVDVMYVKEGIANFCLPINKVFWEIEKEILKCSINKSIVCFNALKLINEIPSSLLFDFASNLNFDSCIKICEEMKIPFQGLSGELAVPYFEEGTIPFCIKRLINEVRKNCDDPKQIQSIFTKYPFLTTIINEPGSNNSTSKKVEIEQRKRGYEN